MKREPWGRRPLLLGLLAAATINCARISSVRPSSTSDGAVQDAVVADSSAGGAAGGAGGAAGRDGTLGSGGSVVPACDCAADLRGVTDCQGHVIKTCGDQQTCRLGACIDACQAAKEDGSAQGCDFYSTLPPPYEFDAGSCFAALVANTWTSPITMTVEYAGQTLDVAQIALLPSGSGTTLTYAPLPGGKLAPGQMAVVSLARTINGAACPGPAGIATDPAVNGTGFGDAFHITTSAPVVAYDIFPYGGAKGETASATLLVPTSAWGINYVAADGYRQDVLLTNNGGTPTGPSVQIVAADDNTQVTINPTADIVGGTGVAASGRGQPHTYALSKGQMLQFWQTEELAGSAISANKPVGVWGGSSCMDIPVGKGACDAAHQQLVPVNLLGFVYTAVRYRDRVAAMHESVPWTLIGAVDGTTLTYDPAPPSGAPASINRGQSVEFSTADAFTVQSADDKHPFYLAGHMTGANNLTQASGPGDPETVNTVPPQQWLSSYVFLTDPTYRTTNLVFVRQKPKDQPFHDVTLDCLGTLTGWGPIGSAGLYEFTTVDLIADGKRNGTCDNGVHAAKSDAPFGLTVWGWDRYVSYAYPAGMGVRKINNVIVIP